MNKFKLIQEITKMVSELERTINTLKQQSESEFKKWKELGEVENLEKHLAIEKGTSEIKVVIDSLINANNWAKRIGE